MPTVDPAEFFTPAAMEDPYPLYARLRERAPVCELEGTGVFFVGSFAAVEEAVRRHEEFSANLTGVLMLGEGGRPRIFDLSGSGTASDVIATADEPDHAVQRRLVQPVLAAARVAELEGEIRAFAAERVARFVAAGGGDWCDAVAESLPAFVLMNLLGLGKHDLETARRWAMMGGDLLGGNVDRERMAELLDETAAMTAFLGHHLDRTLATPAASRGGNLTDALAGGVEAGSLSREQAVGILVVLFGAAGESTASLLGCAVHLLARDAALQERLRRDPARIDAFIEEAVRLESPFRFHYRVVKRPAELCGTALRAGDRLMLAWSSANRDSAVFEDPDAVRLERSAGRRHLGFGRGIHFCVGAPIARLELRVALEELLSRTRLFSLAPSPAPAHVPSIFIRRLSHLHLAV